MSESSLWRWEGENYSDDDDDDDDVRYVEEAVDEPEDSDEGTREEKQASEDTRNVRNAAYWSTPSSVADIERSSEKFWECVNVSMSNLGPEDFRSCDLPLARIKKIMKLDENVRMISAEVPILLSKAADLFIQELTMRAWANTTSGKRRTLQRSDISTAAGQNEQFDFLIDVLPRDESSLPTVRMAEVPQGQGTRKEALVAHCTSREVQIADYVSSTGSECSSNHAPSSDTEMYEEEGYGGEEEEEETAPSVMSPRSSHTSSADSSSRSSESMASSGHLWQPVPSSADFNAFPGGMTENAVVFSSAVAHSTAVMHNGCQVVPAFPGSTEHSNASPGVYYNRSGNKNIVLPNFVSSAVSPTFYVMNTTTDGQILLANPQTVGDPSQTPILQLTQEQLEQIAASFNGEGGLTPTTSTKQQGPCYLVAPDSRQTADAVKVETYCSGDSQHSQLSPQEDASSRKSDKA